MAIYSAIPRLNIDYSFRDFFNSFGGLISNGSYDTKSLEELFKCISIFFTNSGRLSLYIILKAMKLPKGSKIGVPLFCCSSVFDAIDDAGYIPEFIDIDSETYTIDILDLKIKMGDLKALIVVHTFGNPAKINELKKITGNLPIIEDCAHSILSLYNGKITGTLGDVSFFSFRLGKYISAGEGGMILVNNNQYIEKIRNEIYRLSVHSFFDEILHIFINLAKSLLYKKPWYGILTKQFILISDKKNKIYEKTNIKKYKIRKTDLSVLLSKIKTIEKNIEKQRKNSNFLFTHLQNTAIKLPYDNGKNYYNYFYFPIRFNNRMQREYAYRCLTRNGIGCFKLYHGSLQIAKNKYGYKTNCPNTEHCAETMLIIPNFYTLTNKELLWIVREVKNIDKKLKSLAIGEY